MNDNILGKFVSGTTILATERQINGNDEYGVAPRTIWFIEEFGLDYSDRKDFSSRDEMMKDFVKRVSTWQE